MKVVGYLVVEYCEGWEQILGLDIRDEYPRGGILDWVPGDNNAKACLFPTRRAARDCIDRTEYMRRAFGWTNVPAKKNCRIDQVVAAPDESER